MIMAELLDQDDAIEELDILFDIQGRARIQRPLRDKMNPLTGYDDNDFFFLVTEWEKRNLLKSWPE